MSFNLGDKVICIDSGEWHKLTVGKVYTIIEIEPHFDGYFLYFEETPGGWKSKRFAKKRMSQWRRL